MKSWFFFPSWVIKIICLLGGKEWWLPIYLINCYQSSGPAHGSVEISATTVSLCLTRPSEKRYASLGSSNLAESTRHHVKVTGLAGTCMNIYNQEQTIYQSSLTTVWVLCASSINLIDKRGGSIAAGWWIASQLCCITWISTHVSVKRLGFIIASI